MLRTSSVALAVVEAVWAIGCVTDVGFQVLIFAENVLVFFVENNRAAIFICAEVLSKFLAKELLFALVEGFALQAESGLCTLF